MFEFFFKARIWSRERFSSSQSLYIIFLETILTLPSPICVTITVTNFESNFFANINAILSYLILEEIISTIGCKIALDFVIGDEKIQSSSLKFLLSFFSLLERLIT